MVQFNGYANRVHSVCSNIGTQVVWFGDTHPNISHIV